MLYCILLICILQYIGANAIAQSRTKDPMSWKDILNKAGPPVQPRPQEPPYVPEPGDDIFGPNPLKLPSSPIPPNQTDQSSQLRQGDKLKVINVEEYDALYIRRHPSQGSKILGMIPPQTTGVSYLGQREGDWILVRYDHTDGWVSLSFVRKQLE